MPVALATDLDDLNIRFTAAITALEAALILPAPDAIELGKRRAALARVTTERVRFIHGRLCPMLASGPTPRHAAAARLLRDRVAKIIAASNRHIHQWTAANVAADWAGYGKATRAMAGQVRAAMAMDRQDIYPLLATVVQGRDAA